MTLPGLLLLSLLTVSCSGCNSFKKTVIQNLKKTIDNSEQHGFREVFPRDYLISHHFHNETLLCDTDPCCMVRAATVLFDSWSKLLVKLWRQNQKYAVIREIQGGLNVIADNKFLDPPDLSALPTVSSSPEALLSFTSSLFSTWLKPACWTTQEACAFPTMAEVEVPEELKPTAVPTMAEVEVPEEVKPTAVPGGPRMTAQAVHTPPRGKEGEREKRWSLSPTANNEGGASTGLALWWASVLWTVLDSTGW